MLCFFSHAIYLAIPEVIKEREDRDLLLLCDLCKVKPESIIQQKQIKSYLR